MDKATRNLHLLLLIVYMHSQKKAIPMCSSSSPRGLGIQSAIFARLEDKVQRSYLLCETQAEIITLDWELFSHSASKLRYRESTVSDGREEMIAFLIGWGCSSIG